jgi:hypothetical protein
MNQADKKTLARLNAAWLAGENIEGLKFLHNSTVEVILPDGTLKTGWIVAATVDGPEPIYTVEANDGAGDIECPESTLRIVDK